MPRRRLMTIHVFEKVRLLDITLAEFDVLLDGGEVIEATPLGIATKEVRLLLDWHHPLHVVAVVDDVRGSERIVTVYEPEPDRWSRDFRERRRR